MTRTDADREVDTAIGGVATLAAKLAAEITELEKRLAERKRQRERLVQGTQRIFAGDPNP